MTKEQMPERIYASDGNIEFPGLWVRKDIADKDDTEYIRADLVSARSQAPADRAEALDMLFSAFARLKDIDGAFNWEDEYKTIRAALTNSVLDGALQKAIEALQFYADDAKYCGIIKESDGATVFEWPMYRDHGTTAKEALRELEPWVKGVG